MGRSNRVGPDPVMDISSQLRADDLKWMHRAIELARQGAPIPKADRSDASSRAAVR